MEGEIKYRTGLYLYYSRKIMASDLCSAIFFPILIMGFAISISSGSGSFWVPLGLLWLLMVLLQVRNLDRGKKAATDAIGSASGEIRDLLEMAIKLTRWGIWLLISLIGIFPYFAVALVRHKLDKRIRRLYEGGVSGDGFDLENKLQEDMKKFRERINHRG